MAPLDGAMLSRQIESGTVAHAYLFVAPDRQGQINAARGFVSHVAAKSAGWDVPLMRRRIEGGMFSGLLEINPDGTAVKIGDIRRAISFLSTSSLEGGGKFACVYGAERMTEPAQNALLKTLEGPPRDSCILLCAASTDGLVETVLSRVAVMRPAQGQDGMELPALAGSLREILLAGDDSLAFSAAASLSKDRARALSELESMYNFFASASAGGGASLLGLGGIKRTALRKLARLCLGAISSVRQNVPVQLSIECMFIQMQEVIGHAENSGSPF
jgi:hypothetical protein